MDSLKMYFLLKMGIVHCYVSLPEGTFLETNGFSHLKMDPQGSWLTLSDDEQGVYNHLQNARYLGSITILRR